MDWHTSLVEAPAQEPLTLTQVKTDRGGIEHDLHNDEFELLIQAARQNAEKRTGRALIDQKWQQIFTEISRDECALPLIRWPVKSIDKVEIDGVVVDHSGFEFLPGDDSSIYSETFAGKRVIVTYNAGYGDESKVPASIKKWMLATVGSMYEHRETVVTGTIVSRLSFIDNLISNYRVRVYR